MVLRESKSAPKRTHDGKVRRFVGNKSKKSTGKKLDHGVKPCRHSKSTSNEQKEAASEMPKDKFPTLLAIKKTSFNFIFRDSSEVKSTLQQSKSITHDIEEGNSTIKNKTSRKQSVAKRLVRLKQLAGFGQSEKADTGTKELPGEAPKKAQTQQSTTRSFLGRIASFGKTADTSTDSVAEELPPTFQTQTVTRKLLRRISNFGRSEIVVEGSKSNIRKQSIARRSLGLSKLPGCGRSKIAYEESKRKTRKHSFSKGLRARFASNFGPVQIVPEEESPHGDEQERRGGDQHSAEETGQEAGGGALKSTEGLLKSTVSPLEPMAKEKSGCLYSKSRGASRQKTYLSSPVSSFSEFECENAEVTEEEEEEPVAKVKYSRMRLIGTNKIKTEAEMLKEEEIDELMKVQEFEEKQEDIRRLRREERRRKRQNASNWKRGSMFTTMVTAIVSQKKELSDIRVLTSGGVVLHSFITSGGSGSGSGSDSDGDSGGGGDAALYDPVGRFRH